MKKALTFILWILTTTDAFHIKTSQRLWHVKYLQGLHYSDGRLYYGTNDGSVVCLTRNEKGTFQQMWRSYVSKRNIRKIKSTQDHMLVSCDPIMVSGIEDVCETGRTLLCELESGNVVDSQVWHDTTVYETITEHAGEWVRCNVRGDIFVKSIKATVDTDICHRGRIPLRTGDFLSSAFVYEQKLYAISVVGEFFVMSLKDMKVQLRDNIHFKTSTSMHVLEPYKGRDRNTIFVYIGNASGEIYFIQITEEKCISHSQKKVHDAGVTQIESNSCGVFFSFDDSTIKGMEALTMQEFFSKRVEGTLYHQTDSFCLSPRGLFSICNSKDIEMTILKGS